MSDAGYVGCLGRYASSTGRVRDPRTRIRRIGAWRIYFETYTNCAAEQRLHITYEITGGIARHFSMGVMQLTGNRQSSPLESAGLRLVPNWYAPRAWRLPVNVGLVAEFSFQNAAWSADTRAIEIVPILEKRSNRIQLDLNPAFGRSLHGPGTRNGWVFGFAARAGVQATDRVTPGIEYYSDWGRIAAPAPLEKQTHQILPGGDIRLAKDVLWSVGIGIGTTPATSRVVYKSRLEISFGGKRGHRPRH